MKNFGRGMWRRISDYEKYIQQLLYIETKEEEKRKELTIDPKLIQNLQKSNKK